MAMFARPLLIIIAMLSINCLSVASAEPDFERDVAPLLIKNCLECHKATDPSGGLNLSSHEGLVRGGDSGAVIDQDKRAASPLWQRVHSDEMPPEKNSKPQPLPEPEKQILKAWVDAGAPWPEGRILDAYERTTAKRGGRDWWAFQPLLNATPPSPVTTEVTTTGAQPSPIDAFLARGPEEPGF